MKPNAEGHAIAAEQCRVLLRGAKTCGNRPTIGRHRVPRGASECARSDTDVGDDISPKSNIQPVHFGMKSLAVVRDGR